jgi:hypothetical protein
MGPEEGSQPWLELDAISRVKTFRLSYTAKYKNMKLQSNFKESMECIFELSF